MLFLKVGIHKPTIKIDDAGTLLLTLSYDANIVNVLFQYVLEYIPTPVLDGLFLYLAITALYGNQMFERFTLLFTEQVCKI